MTSLLNCFVPVADFNSYEDFKENFTINVPDNFNFAYDVVDVYAAQQPQKQALVWCDDNDNEAVFNFRDLQYYSNKTANVFAKYGIKKGDNVMLILKSRYEFWFCLLALHRIGAVAVPATHMLTKKDIVYRVELADIKAVVCARDDYVLGEIDAAHKECGSILKHIMVLGAERKGWINFNTELEAASENFNRPTGEEATTNSDISIIYFSSGTTGLPKMVQHDFAYPLAHIITAKYWQNVTDGGLHYTVADSGWAKCIWGKIYGQWIAGSAVFVYDYDRFSADKMLENTARYNVTTFCAPPTIYRFLIREDLSKYDFSKLKYCVVAGEPLNPEVYEQFLELTGLKLMEGFGQTETVVSVATYPWMEPKPGSMGKPSPLYDIELLNAQGNACEVGEEGELCIDTSFSNPPGIFAGYRLEPERTADVWHDGYYHTGDMAWKDEDGYFWFVGRADDIIKTSGYRVGPFEVESALIEHPAVLECAITGVPDPIRGQVIKATIVLTKNYTASEELKKELQEHVKKVTAPYKYPRIVEFVSELPKTISGKIRRVEIRDKDKEQ
ncbi:MAG: 3-hydroxypropionyl-coenzyme A synthetase [Methanomethylovorans sp. PtaU1.Bin093]|jgi:acetyl-CoA synthetase|uniref:AMP-binding protein n=1 Tax=Methanomethylovorans sp. PtaU1.Bin093 TaxID=1811679 RepID=UPI0009CA44D3|nr:AMP-binding protein [Methanomethylovorans sp. PtaU1.Bin093]OPY20648.1 MAG: 3-hydroxypropionyl-coenzyme A synthetase [Methanomethylovorans sp. PtaU1.Bin093]